MMRHLLPLCGLISIGCAVEGGSEPDDQTTVLDQDLLAAGEKAAWVVYTTGGGVDVNRSWNSTGGCYGVSNPATGNYTVTLCGSFPGSGNPQVNSLGADNARCNVKSWAAVGATLSIDVRCHTAASIPTPVNSNFVVSYARFSGGSALSPLGAYVYMDQPTGGALNPNRMWGDTITVSTTTTGIYVLTFAAQSLTSGNFQVTAVSTTTAGDPDRCHVDSWTASTVTVRCYDSAAALKATRFSFRYTRGESNTSCPDGIHDTYAGSGGYVWYTGVSTPAAAYELDVVHTNPQNCVECMTLSNATVEDKGPGNEIVNYPNLGGAISPPPRMAAIVTAHGSGSAYCKLAGIGNTTSAGRISINCWNGAGTALVDTNFFQLLFHDGRLICI